LLLLSFEDVEEVDDAVVAILTDESPLPDGDATASWNNFPSAASVLHSNGKEATSRLRQVM
jgi:hypothetical protein